MLNMEAAYSLAVPFMTLAGGSWVVALFYDPAKACHRSIGADVPKLTKTVVDSLVAADGKPIILWDTISGFGVKALPSGKKMFVVKYRANGGGRSAQQRWLTIGQFGHITCEQARSMAQQALAAVARGEDPQGDKTNNRSAPRLKDVWDRFAADQLPMKKPGTRREYESQWRDLIKPKFGSQLVKDIKRADIDRFHKSLRDTPYRANRALALFSRLMTLTEHWEWRDQGTNPCRFVEKFKEEGRERFLDAEEIGRIATAINAMTAEGEIWPDIGNAVKLLLLTGARLTEITNAKWEWVDWKLQILALPDSKTGKKPVYLGATAIELLRQQQATSRDVDSIYIFPGRSAGKPLHNLRKPWGRICERAGIQGVRLHDLRHTAASIAVGQGVTLPVIGALLGHSQAQTTLRYAHVASDPALIAVDAIGRIVADAWTLPKSPQA
jgi:integrase